MANSTPKQPAPAVRPPKPFKDYPLTPHANGKWQKKIGGKIYYFGFWARRKNGVLVPVDDKHGGAYEALDEYKEKFPDGPIDAPCSTAAEPPPTEAAYTLGNLFVDFLEAKNRKVANGAMKPRSFKEYMDTIAVVKKAFGKDRVVSTLTPQDFSRLATYFSKYGPARRGNNIQRVKTIFNYAATNKLIDRVPAYGDEFVKPSKTEYRRTRNAAGKRLFTQAEALTLLNGRTRTNDDGETAHEPGADAAMRAMIFLGINCGLGNTDCAELSQDHLDLDGGWLKFPRPKTEVDRRSPLWPETVAALRDALACRPTPASNAERNLVFTTPTGQRVVRERVTSGKQSDGTEFVKKVTTIDSVAVGFRKLLKRFGINGRKGLGFYSLRHTFRTVADATKDFPAVRMIMGHADGSIDDAYRESIDDDRLVAVTNHVRSWLFGEEVDA